MEPPVESIVYAYEKRVPVFDHVVWQQQVFIPIAQALADTQQSYGKREGPGRKVLNLKAPDGTIWNVSQPGNGRAGEIFCSTIQGHRLYSLDGVRRFMESTDAFKADGVCAYAVTGPCDATGELPVRSVSCNEEFTLSAGSWHASAEAAARDGDGQTADEGSQVRIVE